MMAKMKYARGSRLIGKGAFADRLGVKLRTVDRMIARGDLKPVRLPGVRRVLLAEADVERLIAGSA
jgi:excisionase family DNA binding protein